MTDHFEDLIFAKLDALHIEIEALRLSTGHDIEDLRRLKEHDLASLNLRFEDGKSNIEAALKTVDDANKLAAAAIEVRFQGVNEFRRTLSDQTATFIPRAEVSVAMDMIQREIESLKVAEARLSTIGEANEKFAAKAGADLEQRSRDIEEFRDLLKDLSVEIAELRDDIVRLKQIKN